MYSLNNLESAEQEEEEVTEVVRAPRRRALEDNQKPRPAKRRRCCGDNTRSEDSDEDYAEPTSPSDDSSVLTDEDCAKTDSDSSVHDSVVKSTVAQFMRKKQYLELALMCATPESPCFCEVVRFICSAFEEAVRGVRAVSPVPSPAPSTEPASRPQSPPSTADTVPPSRSPSPPSDVRAESPRPAAVSPAQEKAAELPTVVHVHLSSGGACVVVGDLHGDWDSLMYILKQIGGIPSESLHVLFNGDLIDRGPCSLKVAMLVMALKAQYPEYVHMNRGNHEFMDEGLHNPHPGNLRSDLGPHEELEEEIVAALSTVPLAHVLHGENGDRVCVAHAGLPMDDGHVATLDDLERSAVHPRAMYHWQLSPLEYSVLWNDPTEDAGVRPSPRGGSAMLFGPDKTAEFLRANELALLIRSHQMVESGFALSHTGGVVTVMSTIDPERGGSAAYVRLASGDMHPECVHFSAADILELQKETDFFC